MDAIYQVFLNNAESAIDDAGEVFSVVGEVAAKSIHAFKEVCCDMDAGAYYIAKFSVALLYTVKEFRDLPFIREQFAGFIEIIDLVQLVISVDTFVNGTLADDWNGTEGGPFGVLGSIAHSVASVGGLFLFLDGAGLISLAGMAQTIGGLPVVGAAFTTVAVVSLQSVVFGAVAVGYVFLTIKSGFDLGNAIAYAMDHPDQVPDKLIIKSLLDLISRTCATALYVTLLIPGVGLPITLALGLVAFGVGIISCLFAQYYKEELEGKEEEVIIAGVKTIVKTPGQKDWIKEEYKLRKEHQRYAAVQ